MNEIQLFNNPEYGDIRTIETDNGEVMFCGVDIARALGYSNPHDALSKHCKKDGVAICEVIDSLGRKQQTKFISEGNVYRLIVHSKLKESEKFESWLFDEVTPNVVKTGSYSIAVKSQPSVAIERELDIRDRESRTQSANILLSIADRMVEQSELCRQTLYAHAANIAVGQNIIEPPKCDKSYTASDIADILGVTPNRIGIIANAHNMKTDEYGDMFYAMDKRGTPRPSFRYNEKALAMFQQLVSEWRAAKK